jgi:hypothetical protein
MVDELTIGKNYEVNGFEYGSKRTITSIATVIDIDDELVFDVVEGEHIDKVTSWRAISKVPFSIYDRP